MSNLVLSALITVLSVGCSSTPEQQVPDAGGELDASNTDARLNNPTTDAGDEPLVTAAGLCADPHAYDGRHIRVSADEVSESVGMSLVDCGECCNSAFTDFVLECDGSAAIVLTPVETADWPTAEGRAETANAIASSGWTTQMGCLGQDCYQICAPGRLSELALFTGVFRLGEFTSPAGDGQYAMALEVESFERAGDGCPDFASECPDHCRPIMGRKFDEATMCVGERQIIGCTAAEMSTNDLACVKRAETTYRYEIFSGSEPFGTDWLFCEHADLPDWPDCG